MKPILDKNIIMMGMAMQQAETNRLLRQSMMTPSERAAYDRQEREADKAYEVGCIGVLIMILVIVLGLAIFYGITWLASLFL